MAKNTETATQVRRGLPLRVGLVAATLVLVACGLAASGIMVTSILRHSLVSRIDQPHALGMATMMSGMLFGWWVGIPGLVIMLVGFYSWAFEPCH